MQVGAVIAAAGMSPGMGDFKPMMKRAITVAQRVQALYEKWFEDVIWEEKK